MLSGTVSNAVPWGFEEDISFVRVEFDVDVEKLEHQDLLGLDPEGVPNEKPETGAEELLKSKNCPWPELMFWLPLPV